MSIEWGEDDGPVTYREVCPAIIDGVGRLPELPGERIERDLRARIGSGEWEPGEQLPTSRELAGHYGVSTRTIHRVLHRLEDDGLIVIRGRWGVFIAGA